MLFLQIYMLVFNTSIPRWSSLNRKRSESYCTPAEEEGNPFCIVVCREFKVLYLESKVLHLESFCIVLHL